MKQIKRFEVGKRYSMRSACDHDCVWYYLVKARTEKTVTLVPIDSQKRRVDYNKTLRINASLSEALGAEAVRPLGSYSMAPILTAE